MECLEGKIKLYVSVVPNSNSSRIKYIDEEEIKIEIDEPPENNKANGKLIKFLAKLFKIEKTKIQIIGGTTSRHKTILIDQPFTKSEIERILSKG